MPVLSTHETHALFKELGKGSEAALARIYKVYSSRLTGFSFEILRDKELAEEVVMDTLISLWLKREAVAEMDKPVGWLFQCVHYKSLNELKRKKRRHSIQLADEPGFADPGNIQTDLETKELAENGRLEIVKLSAGQKKIIELSRQFGLSRKEIARLFRVSESTIKKQINSAYKKLRKAMKKLSG